MRRRDVLGIAAGAAMWPLVARSQANALIGYISPYGIDDPNDVPALAEFYAGLAEGGWQADEVRVEVRHPAGSAELADQIAADLVALRPDIVFSVTTPPTLALLRLTPDIPIIFANVSDPIGAGLVSSYARPGGNLTGFVNNPGSLGGKWLEFLVRMAPAIRRAGMFFNPTTAPSGGTFFLGPFLEAAAGFGLSAETVEARDRGSIAAAIAAFAQSPGGGLVFPNDIFPFVNRDIVLSEVHRHRLPAIYYNRDFVLDGGLMSYGRDTSLSYPFRVGGAYVARVLNGENPASMPVQAPTQFRLSINTSAATSLGLAVPTDLLATADEVIE